MGSEGRDPPPQCPESAGAAAADGGLGGGWGRAEQVRSLEERGDVTGTQWEKRLLEGTAEGVSGALPSETWAGDRLPLSAHPSSPKNGRNGGPQARRLPCDTSLDTSAARICTSR